MRPDLSSATRIGLYMVLLVGTMPLRMLLQSEGTFRVVGLAVPIFLIGIAVAMVLRTRVSEAKDQVYTRVVVSLFSMITGILGGGWAAQFQFLTPQLMAWIALIAVAVGVLLLRFDRRKFGTGNENDNSLT